ncbi:MAG: aldehyde dehydrogenase family protein [Gammaproteobacteria bacterium]|nr:aldehyde dehydrogenase family protein [Gammaproteobacteria bacterium]
MSTPAARAHYHCLPRQRDLYYGGAWHAPHGGYAPTFNPANQDELGQVAVADSHDVASAVAAAEQAFKSWRDVKPVERATAMRALAQRVRACADEFAMIDAINCGNPVREMTKDAVIAAAQIDYFAGLVHELKGATLPMGPAALNYSVREPLGVVARLVAYNHPLMFLAGKLAPAIAAGNTVIMKPPVQAPLSALRLAELVHECLPPGVVNFLPGDRECGEALVAHPRVRKVALIGSIVTGKAILKSAADKIMPVTLELGGKNPLVIYPDADLDAAIGGAVAGMNFWWAGQSCGSTTRCFVHRSVYEQVVQGIVALIPKRHRCGDPTDMATTMGCLISAAQFDKVMGHIDAAKREGARLVCGGGRPAEPALAQGWFVEPTVFADVSPEMRVFREEIFGPVLAVIPWDDEDVMLEQVNSLDYGLTASVWTRCLNRAHRVAARIEAGYVWINHTSAHFLGADFGGYKQSGMGREEGLEELLSYTQIKNVHVALG